MKCLKYAAILGAALILSACGTSPTKPYTSNPEKSEARNVLYAAQIYGSLRDVPYEKVEKAREEALASGTAVSDEPSLLGAASFGALNYISPPPGLTSLAGGLLGALSWSLIDTTDPSTIPRIVAWMPREMAGSEDEARQKMYDLLAPAMMEALNHAGLEGYSFKLDIEKTSRWGAKPVIKITSTNGLCDAPVYRCAMAVHSEGAEEVAAPEFLGGGPSWGFIGKSSFKPGIYSRDNKANYAAFPSLQLWAYVSAKLPEWAYIYLPGNALVSYRNKEGKGKWLNYPVMFNQGKAMYFIEPKPKV